MPAVQCLDLNHPGWLCLWLGGSGECVAWATSLGGEAAFCEPVKKTAEKRRQSDAHVAVDFMKKEVVQQKDAVQELTVLNWYICVTNSITIYLSIYLTVLN